MSILSGIRVLEFEGIGPAPFCGMTLADLGAEVIVIERLTDKHSPLQDLGDKNITKRGKKSIALDLKNPNANEIVFDLIKSADGLIEGLRPGVMERLGFGPEECLAKKPSLVYGRVTGWGQTGPLAQTAGHDINYIGLSGAAWFSGRDPGPPFAPPTLVGDVAGGALYLTIGMLAGIMRARDTGKGDIVDAAIVDGSAHMMNLALTLIAGGQANYKRGDSMLNGAPWFDNYECEDGGYISIGSVEPKFYALLCEKLGIANDADFQPQYDRTKWPAQRKKLSELFLRRPVNHWRALLEGTDACFSPVLHAAGAAAHPHMVQRNAYYERNGALQAAPAPRFSSSQSHEPQTPPKRGENTAEILSALGRSDNEIYALKSDGAIA